jgi:hypothetical protein
MLGKTSNRPGWESGWPQYVGLLKNMDMPESGLIPHPGPVHHLDECRTLQSLRRHRFAQTPCETDDRTHQKRELKRLVLIYQFHSLAETQAIILDVLGIIVEDCCGGYFLVGHSLLQVSIACQMDGVLHDLPQYAIYHRGRMAFPVSIRCFQS